MELLPDMKREELPAMYRGGRNRDDSAPWGRSRRGDPRHSGGNTPWPTGPAMTAPQLAGLLHGPPGREAVQRPHGRPQ